MSQYSKQSRTSNVSVSLALLASLLWAAILGAIWYAKLDGNSDNQFLHFIARFHVLFVHLPIGMIVLAFAMEFLGYFTAFSHLRKAVPFSLWLSLLGGIVATILGYLLMDLEDFSGRALDLHLYTSLAVVVLTLFTLIQATRERRIMTGLGMILCVLMISASGHFGGAMVHRDDYLTQYSPEKLVPILHFGLSTSKPAAVTGDPDKPLGERLVYQDFIAPMMDQRCDECHNENKTKGKLRTDTYAFLMEGAIGTDTPTIVPGDSEESELVYRTILPEDDNEFMPEGEDPLPPEEIKLLSMWIDAGAKEEMTIAEFGDKPEDLKVIKTVIKTLKLGYKVDESDDDASESSKKSPHATKPAEEKTTEKAPDTEKPADAPKPAESKAAEKPADAPKPAESKAAEKPADAPKPAESKAAEKPADTPKPAESKAVEKPADTPKPAGSKAVEKAPETAKPAAPKPALQPAGATIP